MRTAVGFAQKNYKSLNNEDFDATDWEVLQ